MLLTALVGPTLLAVGASATYAGNLNYGSPSSHHPALGVAIHKVAARSLNTVTGLVSTWDPKKLNFTHGVASGDPTAHSVILWTRAAPMSDNDHSNVTVSGNVPLFTHDNDEFVRASKAPVCVKWTIGKSGNGTVGHVVDSGMVFTSSDIDYTVKVEANHLEPFSTYYYQFSICNSNNTSPLGRTKTIPEKNSVVPRPIKLAVYSCSNFPFGFFNAYGNPVRKDSVDYVLHLGDYIYEYANGAYGWGNSLGRIPQPNKEIFSLYDYRRRLATYRTDLDLLDSHRQFPWIPVWDDHEVADNVWKAGTSHMNNTEDSFIKDGGISFDQRKMNAVRAYFEWMPIRQVDMDDNLRIWRSFSFGSLFDLYMLDTRVYDRDITDLYWNTQYIGKIKDDAGRSIMGPRQEAWLHNSLKTSSRRGAAWRVIGNQVVFSRLEFPKPMSNSTTFNYDAFDGYTGTRNRTLKTLYDGGIGNNVFLAGDSHASWVSDLAWIGEKKYDGRSGAGAIGVEFAGSAVSSPAPVGENITLSAASALSQALTARNDELQWQDYFYRGYFEISIGYDRINASFFGLPNYKTRNGVEISLANFTVAAGQNRLQRTAVNGTTAVGGVAAAGSLKGGKVMNATLAYDTVAKKWVPLSK